MRCDCSCIHIISKSKKRLHSITQLLEATSYRITHSGDINAGTSPVIVNSQVIIVDCVDDFLHLERLSNIAKNKNNVLALIRNSYKNKQYAYSNGAYDYISYPVTSEEIIRRLLPIVTIAEEKDLTVQLCSQESLVLRSIQVKSSVLMSESKHLLDKEKQFVSKVCDYLANNIRSEHSLDDLAKAVGTNRTSLCLAFRNVYGRSVFSWLREVRMREASRLLKKTKLSIQQVCIEIGYKDPANFSTAFKKFCGMSPREFRKG